MRILIFLLLSIFLKSQTYNLKLYNVEKKTLTIQQVKDIEIKIVKGEKKIEFFENKKIKSYSTWKKTINEKLKIIDSLRSIDKTFDIGLIDLSLIYPISDFDNFYVYFADKQVLINNKNKIYSFDSALNSLYGSVENIIEEQKKYSYNNNINYEEAKSFAYNDYKLYEEYFPKDSIRILNLFIKDLSSVIPLNDYQKELIYKNDYSNKIKYPIISTKDKFSIYLFDKDVTYFLLSIINDKDVYNYIVESIFRNDYRIRVKDFLYKNYLKTYPNENNFSNFFKEKILK